MNWIDIKEQKPKINQYCFFYVGGVKPQLGYWKDGLFLCIEDNDFWFVKDDLITHWMELPEPVKLIL